MGVPRFTLLALATCALALAAATPTAAAPQGPWQLPAVDLSVSGRDAHAPQVAIAPDGTKTAVWQRYNGSNNIVQAATRPAGGSFGIPVDLSAAGRNASNPQVAVAPDGTTTVIWYRYDGSNWVVQAATRPAGGSFGTPVDLSAAGNNASNSQVAVAPDGATAVVWVRDDGSNNIVQATTRPAGGSFGTPVDLSAAGNNAPNPQVAVAPDGTTTVVWVRYNGSNNIVQAATRPAGGSFGTPVDLSAASRDAWGPQVAVAPDETTTVIWHRHDGSNYIVQAATRPAGGSFGTPVDLSAASRDAWGPQIAVAPDGTTTVIWYRYDGSNNIVQATTRPAGGSFGTPVDLSAAGNNASNSQVAVAPDGATAAVWQHGKGTNDIVQAAWTQEPFRLDATKAGNGSGQVTSSPAGIDCGSICSETFLPGTAVTVIAIPEPNSTFTGWYGACTVSAHACQITMNEDRQVTASFAPVSHELSVTRQGSGQGTITSSPAGISCGPACSTGFDHGTVVTLTASPDTGSTFTGWSGTCTGTAPTCQVTMNGDRQVTATFGKAPAPKPPVPANPPNDNTAIYNPATGKLKIRLKCGPQYRPKCLTMIARAVTNTGKKAKVMSNQLKVKNRGAGKWGFATLKIKPGFRQQVENMGNKKVKTLWVRIKVTFTKKKKVKVRRNGKVRRVVRKVKQNRTVHHRYRVMVRE